MKKNSNNAETENAADVLLLPAEVKAKALSLGLEIKPNTYTPQKGEDGKKGVYEVWRIPETMTDEEIMEFILPELKNLFGHKNFGVRRMIEATGVRSWQIRAKAHFNPGEAAEPTTTRGKVSKLAREMGFSMEDLEKMLEEKRSNLENK